jgi:hypothetical protein
MSETIDLIIKLGGAAVTQKDIFETFDDDSIERYISQTEMFDVFGAKFLRERFCSSQRHKNTQLAKKIYVHLGSIVISKKNSSKRSSFRSSPVLFAALRKRLHKSSKKGRTA